MTERVITGRHVLAGLIAFFGVILLVNGIFLYNALSTYTGVVSEEPYRKGLSYNERIQAEKQQKTLGWSSQLALVGQGDGVKLDLADKNGNPVSGLAITGRIGRPATAAMDIALVLSENEPGRYEARFDPLAEGTWQIDVEAKKLTGEGDEVVWRARKRLRWPIR